MARAAYRIVTCVTFVKIEFGPGLDPPYPRGPKTAPANDSVWSAYPNPGFSRANRPVMHVDARKSSEKQLRRMRSSPEFTSAMNTQPGQRVSPTLLLAGLIVLAVVLRFWNLGDWNFQATEMFTLRDSTSPQFRNPRPLGYLLTYFLVTPFRPLDEFGLRLLPAVFGVLTVPAFYFVGRRLLGERAALFGALLLTVSPLAILYSQLARYWSLVLLLSAVYPYAIFIGIRDGNRRAFVVGLITAVLATLAHPVSVLLVGGLALWFVVVHLRRPGVLRDLWNQKTVRWAAFLLAIVAVASIVRFIPMLQSWITQHDRNPGSGQFLLRAPAPPGLKQIIYLSQHLESLMVPLVLCAMAGIFLLWRERDRSLAFVLGALALFPMLFLALISLRTPVSGYYLVPTIPVFFLTGAVFLDRLAEIGSKLSNGWVLPATVTAMLVTVGLPTLLSDYRDGRRYDFRGAAQWLESRLGPEDMVYSDQHMVTRHYLGRTVYRLRNPGPLRESFARLQASGGGGILWIVAPAPSHAFRTDLKRGGLIYWIKQHCQLRNTLGVGRVDFRQQYLQLYRCPPAPPPDTRAGTDPASRPTQD
jgi:mannosyltransferase